MKFTLFSLVLFVTLFSNRVTAKPSTFEHKIVKREAWTVFVKTLTGKNFPIDVDPTDTIETIKIKVEDNEGINRDNQRLIYKGQSLKDDRTLEDYNIKDKSTLALVPRLTGN